MSRLAGAFVLVIASLTFGCTSGDTNPNNSTNGQLCTALLTTKGTYTPGPAAPPNPNGSGSGYIGCWGVGTWSFSVTVGQTDCSPSPTPLASYEFVGSYTLDINGDPVRSWMYTTDPTTHSLCKVTEGGTGQCEGELDLYSADGTQVWNFKPEQNADNSISGEGDYTVYGSDQWTGLMGSGSGSGSD